MGKECGRTLRQRKRGALAITKRVVFYFTGPRGDPEGKPSINQPMNIMKSIKIVKYQQSLQRTVKTLKNRHLKGQSSFSQRRNHIRFQRQIISRTQRFDFRRITSQEIIDRLAYILGQEGTPVRSGCLKRGGKMCQRRNA